MDKNEILEKSREENAGKDVAEYAVHKEAFMIAFAILAFLMFIFFIAIDHQSNNFRFLCFSLYLSIGGHSIYKYIRLKRNADLGFGCVFLILSIIQFLIWII